MENSFLAAGFSTAPGSEPSASSLNTVRAAVWLETLAPGPSLDEPWPAHSMVSLPGLLGSRWREIWFRRAAAEEEEEDALVRTCWKRYSDAESPATRP